MEGSQPMLDGPDHTPNLPSVRQTPLYRPPDPSIDKENPCPPLHAPADGRPSRPPFGAVNAQLQLPPGPHQYQFGSADQQPYQPQQAYQNHQQQYAPYQPPVQSYPVMNQYPTDPFQRPVTYQPAAPLAPNPPVPTIDPMLWNSDKVVISAAEIEEMRRTIIEFQEFKNAQNNPQQHNDESQVTINRTIQEVRELQAALHATVAKERCMGERKPRNNPLLTAVHSAMQDLLDVVKVPNDKGEMVEDRKKLPDPLPDGAPPNLAADGTRLYNPRWQKGITQHAENRAYRDASVALIKSRETANPDSEIDPLILNDRRTLVGPVDKYFNTLRTRYKAAHDTEASEKAAKLAQLVKIRNRKKQLAKVVREGAQVLKKHYGAEATENVESAIHTDWMPSEHSDCGNMTPASFDAHRLTHIGHNAGWEVHDLLWRSKSLVKLYLRLVELYHEEQAEKARRTGKKQKMSKRTPTYSCLPENANNNPPALIQETGAMPYRWCVSNAWAARTNNRDLELEEDPDFAIFKLDIPDTDLTAKSLTYLARYED
ncbi:hypothetical protein BDZ97DRAFT_1394586 [Flammula alnicola]|nr:hypothetical protein BDZ97DRAFT_1394586 [Flammula alnicola]